MRKRRADTKDLTGMTFGRYGVIELGPPTKTRTLWRCVCVCGTERFVSRSGLVSGQSQSCGCRNREIVSATHRRHGLSRTSRIYRIWVDMRRRCFDQKELQYKNYGARGITVCERWLAFENFLSDMGHPPEGMSLDRINNDGHYEPGNCRWATSREQARNKRTNHIVYLDGVGRPICEWAEIYGIRQENVVSRLKMGWDLRKALTSPVHQRTLS